MIDGNEFKEHNTTLGKEWNNDVMVNTLQMLIFYSDEDAQISIHFVRDKSRAV